SHFIAFVQNTFIIKKDHWFYIPNLIIRSPQGLPMQVDLLNTINYKNKVLFGIGYRHQYAFYGNLGYSITEKLRIVYSYEYSLGIQNITKGGHEIGITFGLLNKNGKTGPENKINPYEIDEIHQTLDKQQQEMESLKKRVDSLDKNVSKLKMELEILKENQVKQEEVEKAIDKYYSKKSSEGPRDESKKENGNSVDKQGKYKVISPKTDIDYEIKEEGTNANYKIVLGVYQLLPYAKEFQKILLRELGQESKLVQLPDHPKKYIYVCKTSEFTSIKEALEELKQTRKEVKSKGVEVTKGEAWILQTIND
ncbi:MAG: type IX secretion system membrane protein PorP/SprF, partial [Bacteroidia bacterium]|nr:type IX secretion system membrane protein PorP/SprF [Bacteroidia bacterium]